MKEKNLPDKIRLLSSILRMYLGILYKESFKNSDSVLGREVFQKKLFPFFEKLHFPLLELWVTSKIKKVYEFFYHPKYS